MKHSMPSMLISNESILSLEISLRKDNRKSFLNGYPLGKETPKTFLYWLLWNLDFVSNSRREFFLPGYCPDMSTKWLLSISL